MSMEGKKIDNKEANMPSVVAHVTNKHEHIIIQKILLRYSQGKISFLRGTDWEWTAEQVFLAPSHSPGRFLHILTQVSLPHTARHLERLHLPSHGCISGA
jgi:hypothetical protein